MEEQQEKIGTEEGKDRLWQKQFEQDFRKYLEPIKDSIPRDENGRLHILSVGCGNTGGLEANPLVRIFPDSDYMGIDIEEKEIEKAKKLLSYVKPEATNNIKFRAEDGREIKVEEQNKYGLVIIRNPQFLGDSFRTKTWAEIFTSSIKKMAQGGFIFVPTVDSKESVIEYLEDKEFEILTNEHTNDSSPLTYNSKGDVILAKKY